MTGAAPGAGWRRVGDTGVLVELPGLAEVLALQRRVRALVDDGGIDAVDVVPAARTLLVTVPPGHDLDALGRRLVALADDLDPGAGGDDGPEITLEVTYDGPDLDAVAALTGLTPDEVVAAHCGTPWQAAFGGFAPGFVYLTGGDPRLVVPRRDEPRTAVPPGSVGLAGEFSAVYPHASPGGWQLLGRVDEPMWDVDRDPPALIRPGDRVRFVPSRPTGGDSSRQTGDAPWSRAGDASSQDPGEKVPEASRSGSGGGLTVVATGPRATVQDRGRPGLAHLGVSRSGAADRAAHALGQRLLGNDEDAAAVETTLGGLAVRAEADCLVALTGAAAPAQVDGRPVGHAAVLRLAAGQVLRLGVPEHGLRTYLSVRGGIDVPAVLGSRSTDTLARLGPAVLAEGDLLPLGGHAGALPRVDLAPQASPVPRVVTVRVVPGPRGDWLAEPDALTGATWEVSPRSDRVGARLVGPRLARHPDHEGEELASEGVVRGAVQVPGNGQPVVFLADHPVTGGYPVVAVVVDEDVDAVAQLRPGDHLRLTT